MPALTKAADDLCWLLDRGYGAASALTLVGNRYRLNKRQRTAVGRVADPTAAIAARHQRRVPPAELAGRRVLLDGFNLLILLESARGGAVVLRARDGTYRDLGGVHGTYKHVRDTEPALLQVGNALRSAEEVVWFLDRPVSNAGRLKTRLRELAAAHGFPWRAELTYNPDRDLIAARQTDAVVVSSDRYVLDEGGAWCNLGADLLAELDFWEVAF